MRLAMLAAASALSARSLVYDPEVACPDGFEPANIDGAVTFDPTLTLLVADEEPLWVVDTDTGAIDAYPGTTPTGDPRVVRPSGAGELSGIEFALVAQGESAPTLAVFSLGGLTVGEGTRVVAVGSNALVVIVAGSIDIRGELSVAADALADQPGSGPGGFAGGAGVTTLAGEQIGDAGGGPGGGAGGRASTEGTAAGAAGGAGGSGGGRGGDGGDGSAAQGGAAVEPEPSSPGELVPLVGGSGGGAGAGYAAQLPGRGGNGGGAIQISTAAAFTLASTGAIDAAGGAGGIPPADQGAAGGGGGAGGSILIEALELVVRGRIAANGGGGGAGDPCNLAIKQLPEPGQIDRVPALGGEAEETSCSGAGGAGSDLQGVGEAGEDRVRIDSGRGGGGGGGGGRIRLASVVSPEIIGGVLPPVTPDSELAAVVPICR